MVHVHGSPFVITVVVGLIVTIMRAAVHAAAGDLDPSFGSGGSVVTPIGPGGYVHAIIQQPDGKLIAVGGAASQFALARYLENGDLDSSFGTGGMVLTPLSFEYSGAFDAVRQPDGKLLVVGVAEVVTEFSSIPRIGLARYDENGALDPTFGTGGIAVIDDSYPGASAVALLADGKFVVTGIGSFVFARFTASGALDTTFGVGGYADATFGGLGSDVRDLVLQPDGQFVGLGEVVPAFGEGNFALARISDMGVLDPGFGTGGRVITDLHPSFDHGHRLVRQPDGALLAVGSTPQGVSQLPRDFAVVRYDSSGVPDGTFGIGGVVKTDLGFDEEGTGAALQPDGRLVVAGLSQARIGVVRYETDGDLDGSFGTGGVAVTPGTDKLSVLALARQADGKIVVGGGVLDAGTSTFGLTRFLVECGNGVIDAGETCDDGNADSGDCCSSACQFETAGSVCSSPSPCLDAVCDGAGTCNVAIPTGCKQSLPLKSTLKVDVTTGQPSASMLMWKWKRGDETLLGDLGVPTVGDDYRLCGFDLDAPAASSVLFDIGAPAAATCTNGPCWKMLGTRGFRYRDKTAASGVDTLLSKTGAAGKALARVKAKGANLTPPALPLPLPFSVQLQVRNGACFETTFSSASTNDGQAFRGRAD